MIFIAQTPFSNTAQRRLMTINHEILFPIDSHGFIEFRITHIIYSCQYFFHIFSKKFEKIFVSEKNFSWELVRTETTFFSCHEKNAAC
jgi:hypothetical protein